MKHLRPIDILTACVSGVIAAVFFVCIATLLAVSCTSVSVEQETARRRVACRDSLARGDSSEVCKVMVPR